MRAWMPWSEELSVEASAAATISPDYHTRVLRVNILLKNPYQDNDVWPDRNSGWAQGVTADGDERPD